MYHPIFFTFNEKEKMNYSTAMVGFYTFIIDYFLMAINGIKIKPFYITQRKVSNNVINYGTMKSYITYQSHI